MYSGKPILISGSFLTDNPAPAAGIIRFYYGKVLKNLVRGTTVGATKFDC